MMVIPIGTGKVQVMERIIKLEDGSIKTEVFDKFSFVPMLGGKNE
jgi:protein-L-isoaspartate(D-aspartate) O-methyltransferase